MRARVEFRDHLIELAHVTSGMISQVKTPTLAVYVNTAVPFARPQTCCDIVFHLQLPQDGAICDLLWSDPADSSFGRNVVSQLCAQYIGIDSVSGLLLISRVSGNCRRPQCRPYRRPSFAVFGVFGRSGIGELVTSTDACCAGLARGRLNLQCSSLSTVRSLSSSRCT